MSTGEIITLIICIWILTHIFYLLVLYIEMDSNLPLFFTPKDLYQHSKMNAIGCLILYLLLMGLVPIFTVTGIIKWLFTVGRDKK